MLKLSWQSKQIDRELIETIYVNPSQCLSIQGRVVGDRSCRCPDRFSTVMSKDNAIYQCNNVETIGGDTSLAEHEQPYTITARDTTKKTIPSIYPNYASAILILLLMLCVELFSEPNDYDDMESCAHLVKENGKLL